MKKYRVIAFMCIMAIVNLINYNAVYATNTAVVTTSNFWQGVAANSSDFVQAVIGNIADGVCSDSPDAKHHGQIQLSGLGDKTRANRYVAVCDYCGHEFDVSDSVLDSAYTDYTETLPATNINSDGLIIWRPKLSDVIFPMKYVVYVYNVSGRDLDTLPCSHTVMNVTFSAYDDYTIQAYRTDETGYYNDRPVITGSYNTCFSFLAPYSGYYTLLRSLSGSSQNCNIYYKELESGLYDAGTTISINANHNDSQNRYDPKTWAGVHYLYYYMPTFRIRPTAGALNVSSSGDTYNTNTRSGHIVGDYGIIGENNTLSKVENTSIVNETDNSVYNPVTNETHTMSDWSYDYNNRSYNITYQTTDESTGNTTNNKMTVTYGDENVTINEGDQTYTVYYLVETTNNNGGNGGDGGDNHQHTYTSTVTREPTCTDFGIVTYTCTAGDSEYTATTAPLGHLWGLKQEVLNTYDENGELVTAGYKIYKCSRCGEEVRVDDGSGPPSTPNDSSGSGDGGDGDLTIEDPSDDLETFGGKLKAWFQAIPEMFGDLIEFLRQGWSYLPEEVLWLIEFGIGMAVFLGIFNWLLRR